MLTVIYWLITLLIFILVFWNFMDKEKVSEEINGLLILIPFILRVLLIK